MSTWLLLEFAFIALGSLLIVYLLVTLVGERRSPQSTMAWGLGILLLPVLAVPLYLIFGGRRVRRIRRRKGELYQPRPAPAPELPALAGRDAVGETVHVLEAAGLPSPTAGNRVEFVANGQKAYARLMEAIGTARDSLYVQTYILARDEIGRKIVSELARRAAEGVDVRLLIDGAGSFTTRWGFLDPLRRAGGRVGIFGPMFPPARRGSAHLRNHRKLVIVDGVSALVGGMNLGREYMGPLPHHGRWADAGALVTGPVVADLLSVFAADWQYATGEALVNRVQAPEAGEAIVQAIASGPDAEVIPLHDALMVALLRAKQRVWVVTPYFVPDAYLLRTLNLLGRLGRDVRIIVPRRSDHWLMDLARGSFFRDLIGDRVKLFAYKPGMLHAKLLVIDDEIAIVGSANMDNRSLYLNYEAGVMIYSPADVRVIADVIDGYHADAQALTPESGIRRGRLREFAEDVCRLLAPLL